MSMLSDLSEALSGVSLATVEPSCLRGVSSSGYPLQARLVAMRENAELSAHVLRVVASINNVLSWIDGPRQPVFVAVGDQGIDDEAVQSCREALRRCWKGSGASPPVFGQDREFSQAFLRAAALYHDMGKLIAVEHHVPRGVHLMRDVSEQDRREVEALFRTLSQRRCFWSVLRHHDVFGVLNTGEASLAAISSVVGWTAPETGGFDPLDAPIAYVSYMLWLNIADSHAALVPQTLGGLPSQEALRYFRDWTALVRSFDDSASGARDVFRRRSIDVSAHPAQTVERIGRLVSSSFRMESGRLPNDDQIRVLVEEALQDQHGPRFEKFCAQFARFCKLDYASRFLRLLINDCAIEAGAPFSVDTSQARRASYGAVDQAVEEAALRNMAYRTCLILGRIVEEYGDLVYGVGRDPVLLGVDFSKITSKLDKRPVTAEAICESLRGTPARALSWIMDEVSVWLYGR